MSFEGQGAGLASKRRVWLAFLSFSMVSLFADMAYESIRSIIGAYLAESGAPAWEIPVLALVEGLSYAGRLLGGFLASLSPAFLWPLVFLGYGSIYALISVPLVLPTLIPLLYAIERLGKGLRAPPRDTLLSLLTEHIGHGRGFGLHEVFDQIGAVAGPLLLATLIELVGFPQAIVYAVIPTTLAMVMLAIAYILYPYRVREAYKWSKVGDIVAPYIVFTYAVYVFATAALLAYWPAIAYKLEEAGFSVDSIALLYALAMLVDAFAALAVGMIYDRLGLSVVVVPPFLATISLLLIHNNVFAGVIVWGLAMGSVEVLFRAIPATLLPPGTRPIAYGVLGASLAMGWALVSIAVQQPAILPLYIPPLLTISAVSSAVLVRARRA